MVSRSIALTGVVFALAFLSPAAGQAESTPSVSEITSSYTGTSTTYISPRSGARITLDFKKDGILEMLVDGAGGGFYKTWKWWVRDDSYLCTHTSVGERCNKVIKVGDTLHRVLRNGRKIHPVKLKK